jgi:hypothetical protein
MDRWFTEYNVDSFRALIRRMLDRGVFPTPYAIRMEQGRDPLKYSAGCRLNARDLDIRRTELLSHGWVKIGGHWEKPGSEPSSVEHGERGSL